MGQTMTRTHNTASDKHGGKGTMNLLDAHCALMQLVLQDQLLQVVEGLFVDSLKKGEVNNTTLKPRRNRNTLNNEHRR